MDSIPGFRSYFRLTSTIAAFSGIVLLKKLNDFCILDYILMLFGIILTVSNAIFISFMIYYLTTHKFTLLEMVLYIPLIVFAVEGTAKYYFLVTNREVYLGLIQELKDSYTPPACEHEEALLEELGENRTTIMRFQYLYIIQHILFAYPPVIYTVVDYFIFNNWNPRRVLKVWYPFDATEHWLLSYWFELNAARYSAFNAVLPDLLMMMMLLQTNYLFECLGHKIIFVVNRKKAKKHQEQHNIFKGKKISESNKKNDEKEQLKNLVKIHIELIDLCDRINKLFSVQVFWKFISASIVICCTAFVAIIGQDILLIIQYIILLTVILAQTYQLSSFGDELVDKSTLVGTMAYGSEWYLRSLFEQNLVKFIMLRAQKPSFISIYRFAKASRQIFRQIVFNAYQLVTLLNNTYK